MNFAADSSIFVSALFPQEKLYSDARAFVMEVLSGVHQLAVPASVLTEVMSSASRRCEQYKMHRSVVAEWTSILKACKYITYKTIDLSFAHDAAHCGSIYGLKGMDALVGATAIFFNVPLIAEDKDFGRMVPRVTVLNMASLRSFITFKLGPNT